MSGEPYLIAHKVRGAAAFDIAIKMGDWWIIPTSGHRAHPYWWAPLHRAVNWRLLDALTEPPDNWPDHYPPSARGVPQAPKARNSLNFIDLDDLGL